ncbi:hypothetical protein KEX41_29545 (plasmid) [Burkholderia thailandensis]|uniref:hypothetical protein n=1 Tax=Burkholderia thailandensis TaxID=57975 RepID=UPI00192E0CEB|nr:hypothetical protein [Burkholderia thailandensis]MBS2132328.1 hypothetical protein [Burkholderia thailandensis]QRA15135.1 hypothetical protein JMY07_29970 [Burkholderia thailandensis]
MQKSDVGNIVNVDFKRLFRAMHFNPGYIGLALVLSIIFGGAIALAIGIRRGKIQVEPGAPDFSKNRTRVVNVFRNSDGRSDGHRVVHGSSHVGSFFR